MINLKKTKSNAEQDKRKFPMDLFLLGMLNSMVIELRKIFFPSVILMLIGIWKRWVLYVGLAFFIIDIICALAKQIDARNVALYSTNPALKKWQNAILSKNWRENLRDLDVSELEANSKRAEARAMAAEEKAKAEKRNKRKGRL